MRSTHRRANAPDGSYNRSNATAFAPRPNGGRRRSPERDEEGSDGPAHFGAPGGGGRVLVLVRVLVARAQPISLVPRCASQVHPSDSCQSHHAVRHQARTALPIGAERHRSARNTRTSTRTPSIRARARDYPHPHPLDPHRSAPQRQCGSASWVRGIKSAYGSNLEAARLRP